MDDEGAGPVNKQEIRGLARFRAGIILESVLNDWTPEDLIEEFGQDTADEVANEIGRIARRLTKES